MPAASRSAFFDSSSTREAIGPLDARNPRKQTRNLPGLGAVHTAPLAAQERLV